MYLCSRCVHQLCLLPPEAKKKNAVQYPITGVTDSCGFRELNPDPLEKDRVLLISKPSLKPHVSKYI